MKKTFSTVGMILGIVIVVMGLYLAFGFSSSYNGTSTFSYSFGADYYTEQYQATENAADNIMALGEYQEKLVDFSFKIVGLIVSAFGGVITCYFGCKYNDTQGKAITNNESENSKSQESIADELPDI